MRIQYTLKQYIYTVKSLLVGINGRLRIRNNLEKIELEDFYIRDKFLIFR